MKQDGMIYSAEYVPNDVRSVWDVYGNTDTCRLIGDIRMLCHSMLSNVDLDGYVIRVEIKKIPVCGDKNGI